MTSTVFFLQYFCCRSANVAANFLLFFYGVVMQELNMMEVEQVGGGIADLAAFALFWIVAYAGQEMGWWEIG
ncbi:MAG: hypothetical protein HYZ65_08580 [Burkholderiales bacterium]|nr:hypothetical protein [Burkholderiales bacterium]